MAMGEVKVGTVDDFPEGQGRTVDVDGTPIAVFNVDGELHACHNTCLHKGGPLGEGMLEDGVVTCPWHGWQYDVTTGRSTADESLQVTPYEVAVRGGDVFVRA